MGNHSTTFEVLSLGTKTTEMVEATFQTPTAQKKKADFTCKDNNSKENCQGKGNTVLHRKTGIEF